MTDVTLPPARVTVPVAVTPPGVCGAENVTVGVNRYVPPFVMVTDCTPRGASAAVAAAPLPPLPPPEKVTVGAVV